VAAGGDAATFSPSAARDDAEVLAVSCELQRKTARLAEERDAALAGVSAPLKP
jgi:hypothetical protein